MTEQTITDFNQYLRDAAAAGDRKAVVKALHNGANINAQNEDGETALHLAVKNRDDAMAADLLKRRADPNIGDKNGDTPLFYAARSGEAGIVKLLLQYKADPDHLNAGGSTALIHTAHNDHAECCDLLLKYMTQYDVSHQNGCGNTAVMTAVLSGRTEALAVLLKYDPDLSLCDDSGRDAFQLGTQFDMLDGYTMLIDFKEGRIAKTGQEERKKARAEFAQAQGKQKQQQHDSRRLRHTALRNYLRR